jgi:hypothetical protein
LKPEDMPEAQPVAILDDWNEDKAHDQRRDDERYEERGELPKRIRVALDDGDVKTVRRYLGIDGNPTDWQKLSDDNRRSAAMDDPPLDSDPLDWTEEQQAENREYTTGYAG